MQVRARVLTRMGQPVRDLEPASEKAAGPGAFSLPLAWLPAGRYYIEVTGTTAHGTTTERVGFQVR